MEAFAAVSQAMGVAGSTQITTVPLDLNLIFQVLEIGVIVTGVGVTLFKLGQAVSRFEYIGKQQAVEIGEMKTEIKTLNSLLTTVAVQKVELASVREDLTMLRRVYEDLRRGVGMIKEP